MCYRKAINRTFLVLEKFLTYPWVSGAGEQLVQSKQIHLSWRFFLNLQNLVNKHFTDKLTIRNEENCSSVLKIFFLSKKRIYVIFFHILVDII